MNAGQTPRTEAEAARMAQAKQLHAQPIIIFLRQIGELKGEQGQIIIHFKHDQAREIDIMQRSLSHRHLPPKNPNQGGRNDG